MSKNKVRTALVCASSKGLGLASAHALADDGHQIIICSRDEERLKNVALTLQRPGSPKPLYFASDLSRPDQIPKLIKSIYSAVESIDILVNNVGGPPPSAAANTDHQSWVTGFEQLFLSSVLMSQNVLGPMKQNNWGRIITITSLSVVEPIDHLVVSTAMRTAVTAFMKTLSRELASFGVTVNTVQPGVIHTERIESLRAAKASREGTSIAEEMEKTAQTIPMKRLGKPEELGALVAFLASEKASYITGVNIPVDGGLRHSW